MLSLTVPKIPTRSTKRRAPRANDPPVVTTVPPRNDLAQGVATGAIGGDYDPYAVCHPPFLNLSTPHIYCQLARLTFSHLMRGTAWCLLCLVGMISLRV